MADEIHYCMEPRCGRTFGSDRALTAHQKTHLPKSKCSECGKSVQTQNLKRHLQTVHKIFEERPVKVDFEEKYRRKDQALRRANRQNRKLKAEILRLKGEDQS